MKKVRYLIVDGSNYLFRSYFGVPSSAKYKEIKVNAVYGFFAILRKTAKKIDPHKIIVVFDSETGIQNKIKANPNYKSNRTLGDTGMYEQLPIIKEILNSCHIEWIESPEFEADDVIGSLVKNIDRNYSYISISSNDLDLAQLIDNHIVLTRDVQGKIISITKKEFQKQWGFKSSQYRDYLALKGDPTDNVVGVKGVGSITAKNLIIKYHSIERILENIAELNKRLASEIEQGKENLIFNHKFLTINTGLNIHTKTLNETNSSFDYQALHNIKTNEHLDNIGF